MGEVRFMISEAAKTGSCRISRSALLGGRA